MTARLTSGWFRAHAHLGLPRLVTLYLPKFRLEGSTIDLAQNLTDLGMKTAFDEPRGSANFNRAAPRLPDDYLYISRVFHQAFIAIDEEGTEAAAGTAIVMSFAAGVEMKPPEPLLIHVDHPFFFAIQDRASGTCLFFGSVADPANSVNP
jgi:serpin B